MANIKAYGVCLYKKEDSNIKILLCKSALSLEKWGCLKGVEEYGETPKETAQREFYEECNILVPTKLLKHYFEQLNDEKDIGIFLINANNIHNINKFFSNDILHKHNLSAENSKVKFFNLNSLPAIKKKQTNLIVNIMDFLQNKNQSL